METVLIVGATSELSKEMVEGAADIYKIVLTGEIGWTSKHKNISYFDINPLNEKFEQLFDAYTFNAIWYVSGYTNGGCGLPNEPRYIEQVFIQCQRTQVDKVIMLSSQISNNYEYTQENRQDGSLNRRYRSGRAFAAAQLEDMAKYYASMEECKLVILWLPFMEYSPDTKGLWNELFLDMWKKKEVWLPYRKKDRADFLSYSDLLNLLENITDEPSDERGAYYVCSGYLHTWQDVADKLHGIDADIKVEFKGDEFDTDAPHYPQDLRRQYGFIPLIDVFDNISEHYEGFLKEQRTVKRSLWKKLSDGRQGRVRIIIPYMEILIFLVLVELLASITSDSVYFQYVDVRLLYVVIVAAIYGLKKGIVAAVLECFMLIYQFSTINIGIIQLFYNIENWIPFIVYLTAGSGVGYKVDRMSDKIAFTNQEYGLLRDKYLFLYDIYQGALKNKGEYKRQILGFKDSFGKIFDAVQKLDYDMPEKIFLNGLRVLEDLLQNNQIAIYSIDDYQSYGRLRVCSNSQLLKLTKSLKISDHQKVFDTIKAGEVWRNIDLLEAEPMYGAGVIRDGKVVLMIFIQRVNPQQMTAAYVNIFRITCGLVQNSFLRALHYEELQEKKYYYPDTDIMYNKRFNEIYELQEEMKLAGVADFVMLRFDGLTIENASKQLEHIVRATDFLGVDSKETVHLILAQANRDNIHFIEERLAEHKISYQIVERFA